MRVWIEVRGEYHKEPLWSSDRREAHPGVRDTAHEVVDAIRDLMMETMEEDPVLMVDVVSSVLYAAGREQEEE